jgi:putative ABC transport system permease protein
MKTADLLSETYVALSANKVRTGLTMLGIIIGIASVIAMTAVGQGAQKSIQASIQSAGANMLTVYPGQQRGIGTQVRGGQGSAQTLTQDDVEAIKKTVTLAKGVSPELSRRYQITTKGANTNTQVIGTTQDYATVRNFTAQQGTFLTDSNVKSGAKVAVLGPTTRDDLFGADVNAIGKKIRINSIEFTIIGVTTAKGGSGFSNPDDSVFIPITTAQRYLTGNSYVSSIGIQAPDEASMTTIQTEVTALLNERRKWLF